MNVRYRAKALEDIAGIYDRLAAHSQEIAEKVEAAVLASADLLGERPMLGVMTDYANVRRWPMPEFRYAIFYRISTRDYIDVLRVIDGRRVRNLRRVPKWLCKLDALVRCTRHLAHQTRVQEWP